MKLILHWSQKLHWIFFRHFWSPKIDSDKSLQNLSLTKFGVRTWQSSMKNKYERFRDSLTFFLVYLRWLKDMFNAILVIISLLAFRFIMKSFYQILLTWWKIYLSFNETTRKTKVGRNEAFCGHCKLHQTSISWHWHFFSCTKFQFSLNSCWTLWIRYFCFN